MRVQIPPAHKFLSHGFFIRFFGHFDWSSADKAGTQAQGDVQDKEQGLEGQVPHLLRGIPRGQQDKRGRDERQRRGFGQGQRRGRGRRLGY